MERTAIPWYLLFCLNLLFRLWALLFIPYIITCCFTTVNWPQFIDWCFSFFSFSSISLTYCLWYSWTQSKCDLWKRVCSPSYSLSSTSIQFLSPFLRWLLCVTLLICVFCYLAAKGFTSFKGKQYKSQSFFDTIVTY